MPANLQNSAMAIGLEKVSFIIRIPGGAGGKEPACQCWRCKSGCFDPWVGKDPLQEGMATHSSILAWRIPWTEEHGGSQFIGSQRVGHDWSDLTCTHMLYYYQHPGMWGRLRGQKLESETSEEPGYRCCSSRFFPVALLILGRGCRSLKCTLELRFKTTGFRSLMAKIENSNACKGQAAKVSPSR